MGVIFNNEAALLSEVSSAHVSHGNLIITSKDNVSVYVPTRIMQQFLYWLCGQFSYDLTPQSNVKRLSKVLIKLCEDGLISQNDLILLFDELGILEDM